MKKFKNIFMLVLLIILPNSLLAQYSINLTILPGLNTIDFAAFAFTNNLTGSPRIFQVDIIAPAGRKVMIGGKLSWKKNDQTGFVQLINNFITKPFTITTGMRTIFNDELGNSDITIDQIDGNKSVAEEIIKIGKPSGVYGIQLYLYDEQNNNRGSSYREISFLNPAPTITILTPQENSSFDVGNVQAQWTPVVGANKYIVRACALQNASQSAEEALTSGNPIIDDKNIGKVETINLSTILDRQWVGGQRIAFVVTAFVTGPGGGTSLRSLPVIFRLNESGASSTNVINPDLVRLGNLLSGRVSQDFVNKLLNGQISADEIQITDGNNASMSFSSFLNILSFWELHSESIISINYLAK